MSKAGNWQEKFCNLFNEKVRKIAHYIKKKKNTNTKTNTTILRKITAFKKKHLGETIQLKAACSDCISVYLPRPYP